MQRDEIIRIAGPLDDSSLAAIEAMQANRVELLEAMNWLSNDEAMISEGRHLPVDRIATLVEILETPDADLDEWDLQQGWDDV